MSDIRFRFQPYTLQLKHRFSISAGTRLTTPIMLVEIEKDGIIGYGEASMPPYLGETNETATAFFAEVDLRPYDDLTLLEVILKDVDRLAPGNFAAKAAVDIALHDWVGKMMGRSWHRIWGLDPSRGPVTSFTIGMEEDREVLRQKVREAEQFKILKVKLGGERDKEMIATIREVTDKPIRVDVNQGWRDKGFALKTIEWLAGRNVELVEQPMPKEKPDEQAWLKERSPLPIIADESVVRLPDVQKAVGLFHGINIKLMKCTGVHEALKMILLARELGLEIMLGCMTETSCAISAAAQLSPLVDYADLDGALLITNDPFEGATFLDGKLSVPTSPGIGVRKSTH